VPREQRYGAAGITDDVWVTCGTLYLLYAVPAAALEFA